MPIKLPITEKFLWDLHKFMNITGGVIDFFVPSNRPYHFRGPEEMTLAEIKLFKDNWEYNYKKKEKRFCQDCV